MNQGGKPPAEVATESLFLPHDMGERAIANPKKAILIGAGLRGTVYARYALAHPAQLTIVGVAEPREDRRARIARLHNVPSQNVFKSWRDILERPQMADGAIIATQDTMHVEPAVAALERGYHLLLEKPMALKREECSAIVNAELRTGLTVNVCHVLRYTDFFSRVKGMISQGLIGDIYSMYLAENISYYHMAHSYVRGKWRNSSETSPMILAKCCHDLDLIYWYAGSRPKSVSSSGGLHHFLRENSPAGAPMRCTDGCPHGEECQYNAVNTYLRGLPLKLETLKADAIPLSIAARFLLLFPNLSRFIPGLSRFTLWRTWPTTTITEDLSREGIMKSLREGPYGRCVYQCDNDQVDHQETIIEFENGITAMQKMHGHSAQEGRTLRIDGSKGTIRGTCAGGGRLEVHIHRTGRRIVCPVKTDLVGHTEGDHRIMKNFVQVLSGGQGLSSAMDSLQSHLMAFASHQARIENRVVEIPLFSLQAPGQGGAELSLLPEDPVTI